MLHRFHLVSLEIEDCCIGNRVRGLETGYGAFTRVLVNELLGVHRQTIAMHRRLNTGSDACRLNFRGIALWGMMIQFTSRQLPQRFPGKRKSGKTAIPASQVSEPLCLSVTAERSR